MLEIHYLHAAQNVAVIFSGPCNPIPGRIEQLLNTTALAVILARVFVSDTFGRQRAEFRVRHNVLQCKLNNSAGATER